MLPCLAYAPYLLAGGADLVAQTRGYAPRFGLGRPGWYVANLLAEAHRWGPGLGPFGSGWLLRPGVFAALAVLPPSLLALARRGQAGDRAARAALAPAVILPALFGLLLTLKLPNYLATVVPALAVVAAWGGVAAWRRWGSWRRVALGAAALACLAEGAARVAALEAAAARTTPYPAFIARVRAALPPHGRILALHWMWFGLEDRDVRSFLVPLLLADAAITRPARPVAEALDAVAPDLVLVDRRLRAYLGSPRPGDRVPGEVAAWLAAHGTPIGTVDDATYGCVEVLAVRR